MVMWLWELGNGNDYEFCSGEDPLLGKAVSHRLATSLPSAQWTLGADALTASARILWSVCSIEHGSCSTSAWRRGRRLS